LGVQNQQTIKKRSYKTLWQVIVEGRGCSHKSVLSFFFSFLWLHSWIFFSCSQTQRGIIDLTAVIAAPHETKYPAAGIVGEGKK
jgi:hypothetical protein